MHSVNPMNSDAFLINIVTTLINSFLEDFECSSLEKTIVIDTKVFTCEELAKIEKVDSTVIKSEAKLKQFNMYTKSFLFAHLFFGHAIESLSNLNRNLLQQAQTLSGNPTSPDFKKAVAQLNSIYGIFKCPKFIHKIMNFLEVTVYLLFTRNNSKYTIDRYRESGIDYFKDFYSDFTYFIKDEESADINAMPVLIFKNIAKFVKFMKEVNPDIFNKYVDISKSFIHFSLIYSSKTKIIKHPYLRAEALDIVEYLFFNQNNPKAQPNKLIQIFNDQLIKENFLYSLIRVFIDSERLGGSNQFYEKFSVRYKILLLVESIKSQISIDDQLIFYAVKFKDDCIVFINFLMNDLTFLAEETIEKLKAIKAYQDQKADKIGYELNSQEDKARLEELFNDNSKRCKQFIPLFNSSLQFMINISNTCQSLILEYKLGQRLANLMNYLLQMFASKNSDNLKIQNFTEYKFSPKEILKYIITVYSNFVGYNEFLNNIVQDERCFKIDNFIRASNLRTKLSVPFNVGENYVKLVGILSQKNESASSNIIDYSDAPEEFLDVITAEIMEDPVKLPTSGQIVDRTTIEQHLLSDPTDPFNRQPLDKFQLIPDINLRERIEQYKRSKK